MPAVGVTKDGLVINVVSGLSIVIVKGVSKGASVVTNEFLAVLALGHAALIANAVDTRGVLADVKVGKESVKDAAVLLWKI